MATPVSLSIGDVAKRLGCEGWEVRRVFTRGLLPEPARVAGYRAIPEQYIPTIKAALVKAGYLRRDETNADRRPKQPRIASVEAAPLDDAITVILGKRPSP